MRPTPLVFPILLVASPAAFPAQDPYLPPIVVRCGIEAEARDLDRRGRILPDLAFDLERGWGHVGGAGRIRRPAPTIGGDASWPIAWREGMETYVFRLPNGEYVLGLTFLETEVAHPGLRRFDVIAEGAPVFEGLDIYQEAGDFAWLELSAIVAVRDGWLDIRFVSSEGSRPPCVSAIRIAPAAAAGPPGRPSAVAHGGVGSVILRWKAPPSAEVRGYRVLRSDSRQGPFSAVGDREVRVPWWVDREAEPAKEWSYRVQAIDVRGREGEPSEVVSASARAAGDLGLKVYELRLAEDALRALSVPGQGTADVRAELRFLDAVEPVLVRVEGEPASWGPRRSYRVRFEGGGSRAFGRRRGLILRALDSDPTRIGRLVLDAVGRELKLESLLSEPVTLLVNGRHAGLYLDEEVPDRRFRARTGLDRVGLLARRTRPDALEASWEPRGERIDEGGNIHSLTELHHELNLVEEGETRKLLESTLEVPRLIDRAALAALAGEPERGAALDLWLRDSRNGRWHPIQGRWPSGPWGPATSEPHEDEADPARLVFGSSALDGGGASGPAGVLETRFLREPTLRVRFLSRLQDLLAGPLSPARFREIVDARFASVREAAVADAILWPAGTSPAAILDGPARLEGEYAARVGRITGTLALETSRRPSAVVISEILASPAEGPPWIELANVSREDVRLDAFWLAKGLGDPTARGTWARLPARSLVPGGCVVVPLTAADSFALAPSDLQVALHPTREGAGAPRPAAAPIDLVFLGRPTRGISAGRPGDAPGRWAWLKTPTPGEPNAAGELAPPTWRFAHGLVRREAGGFVAWLRPIGPPDDRPGARVASAVLLHREDGAPEVSRADMAWDREQLRYSAPLEDREGRKPIAYWFVVTSSDGVERAFPLPAPALTLRVPVLPEVKINEILPRPIAGTTTTEEFIELYNASDAPVDLEGYHLTDSARNPTRWRIPAGSVVPPKGFLVFTADGLDEGRHTSFRLSNAGEYVGLCGRMEEGTLKVDAATFGGMRAGESWGAFPDGTKSFRSWKDPTPGARNVPKIPEEYLRKRAAQEPESAPPGDETAPGSDPDPVPSGESPPELPPDAPDPPEGPAHEG